VFQESYMILNYLIYSEFYEEIIMRIILFLTICFVIAINDHRPINIVSIWPWNDIWKWIHKREFYIFLYRLAPCFLLLRIICYYKIKDTWYAVLEQACLINPLSTENEFICVCKQCRTHIRGLLQEPSDQGSTLFFIFKY